MALSTPAQSSTLGSVKFPTSCTSAAQPYFLRGVAALHSFWFEEALEAFRAATSADPRCVMGYWGEAMAHNHPLWMEQDTEAARAVIAKVRDVSGITARERAYWDALVVLYGEGDKLTRDRAYAAAMEKVSRAYPDDLEAAIFHSLALLGTVRMGDKGYRAQAQAGAIALGVFQKNPNHPGAAHFIIHAFDDPEHAILALPAAFRYAQIAPEAHHARHMPSHIFIQLGMWPEGAASNQSAWEASVNWTTHKKLSPALRDLHSLHWWTYIALQQGKYAKAEELFALRNKTQQEAGADSSGAMGTARAGRYHGYIAGALVVEREDWKRAAELFPANGTPAAGPEHVHGAPPPSGPYSGPSLDQMIGVFVRGLAAAHLGTAEAAAAAGELQRIKEQLLAGGQAFLAYRAKFADVMSNEVLAQVEAQRGNLAKAAEYAARAVAVEEEMSPPSGPPDLLKPAHELYGEILLRAGQGKEAGEMFARSLLRQPNRARSLVGAARAAAKAGDMVAAAAHYAKLAEIWRDADTQFAELREARDFLKQQAARAGGN
jgi:tetratricopeptide (TPR) repeat protein